MRVCIQLPSELSKKLLNTKGNKSVAAYIVEVLSHTSLQIEEKTNGKEKDCDTFTERAVKHVK